MRPGLQLGAMGTQVHGTRLHGTRLISTLAASEYTDTAGFMAQGDFTLNQNPQTLNAGLVSGLWIRVWGRFLSLTCRGTYS